MYNPVTITSADPVKKYEMTSLVAPGYVTKWKDYSGDLNGDGQISSDEYFKLKIKWQNRIKLDDVYKNPAYKELFWVTSLVTFLSF